MAEDYDRIRPGYPASLIDGACATGGLRPGSPAVEVGCGTGKLTGALVERGLRVDAVDPGRELIEIARSRVGESSALAPLRRAARPPRTADVAHEPWPLQPARAEIRLNRMAPRGLAFRGEPLLHFCRSIDALISAPVPIGRAQRSHARARARLARPRNGRASWDPAS